MTQMRLEELRGILWPLEVWKRVKNCKAPATFKVHTIEHSGRKIKGYLLDETYGRPVGSIAIYGDDSRFVSKAGSISI